MLEKMPGMQVAGEVSDGLEAVHKAEELQPDLIVLDIGLPTISGLEAARRIRKLSPNSKILFVSQESSPEVVEAALSLGAMGYVVKASAGTELSLALEAFRQGRQFVGRDVSSSNFTAIANAEAPTGKTEITRRHEVRFHPDEATFLHDFTCFIEGALKAEHAVIVIATEAHLQSIAQRLHRHGADLAAALEEGRYIPLNVDDILSSFMANGLPEPVRFQKVVRDLITSAAKSAKGNPPRVVACGECSPALWSNGKADAAIQLEHLYDGIAREYGVEMLCGYVLSKFQREHEKHIYDRICAEHSAVYPE